MNGALEHAQQVGRTYGEPGAKRVDFLPDGRGLGRAVWAKAKTEYVTGNESLAQLAERLGVTPSAVEKHARPGHRDNGGISWDQARANHLKRKGQVAELDEVASGARELAQVKDLTARAARRALEKIEARLANTPETITTSDLIGIAKLATSLRIELANDPSGDLASIHQKLAQLTVDELRAIVDLPVSAAEGNGES